MIPSPQEKITNIQASIAVSMTIIGAGIITLPRTSTEATQTPDAWLSFLFSGCIAMVAAFFIVKLSQMFPNQTFYQFSHQVVGKPLGYILNFVVIFYFTMLVGFEVRTMGEVIRMYLLDQTPIEVTSLIFMSVGVYLVTAGVNPLLKLFELYFPVLLFLIVLMLALSFTMFEFNNIRPLLGEGIKPVLKGIKPTALSYTGFEVMFILTAYMEKPKKAIITTFIGIWFSIAIYIMVLILVIGALTVEEVRLLTFPTMELVKSIEIKGLFFERFESFFIIIWIISTFTTYSMGLYIASLGLSQTFNKKRSLSIFGLSPFIYIFSVYPTDINGVFKYGDYVGNLAIFVAGIMPLLLWIIAFIRRKRNAKS